MDFYITGAHARPPSRQTIFADGSADDTFREGVDLELSHWVPNRTPPRYKADTSTEICLNFVADPLPGDWDLAINNHLDVDGVLGVYVLTHPERALAHRDTLAAASRMGDFWDWGPPRALRLFQGLTSYMFAFELGKTPLQSIYARCFARIDRLLDPNTPDPAEVLKARDVLETAEARLASGEVTRRVYHPRFVHYQLDTRELARALHVPPFNAAIDGAAWFPPQARNRRDREKVQLVSVAGGYHDLWYPGYRWAETPDAWVAPGFRFAGSTNGYYYGHPPLEAAVKELQAAEANPGTWTIVDGLSPFASLKGRNYPVVLSFLDEQQQPAPSSQAPEAVASRLSGAFEES